MNKFEESEGDYDMLQGNINRKFVTKDEREITFEAMQKIRYNKSDSSYKIDK